MEITYRRATPEDAESIRRVATKSWHATYDSIIGSEAVEETIDEWYELDGLASSITRDGAPMFLAIADRAIGFAQGGRSNDGPAGATVSRIYVVPEQWGSGCGSELLNRLFEEFRAVGHDSVWLAVMAENEVGRSFYDSHDFRVHEKQTVKLAGQPVEELVLVRDL